MLDKGEPVHQSRYLVGVLKATWPWKVSAPNSKPSCFALINCWHFFWRRHKPANDIGPTFASSDGDADRVPCQKMCPGRRSLINCCASASHSRLTQRLTWQRGAFPDLKPKEIPHISTTETGRQTWATRGCVGTDTNIDGTTDGALALVGPPGFQ